MKRLNRQNLMNNLLENFLNTLKKGNDTKEKGQIFTPFWCVDKLLDEVNYAGSDIIMKEILEPSFGDGAILTKIIIRYINECNKLNFTKDTIRNLLNRQIKGVELDTELYLQTKEKLNNLILELYQLEPIKWLGLTNEDTLLYKEKDFDFIVGNPPYLNIQKFNKYARANNLQEIDIKKYPELTYKKGGSDLYLFFFEKCINLLKEGGRLSFITPNSFFSTNLALDFRTDLIKKKLLKKIINYKFNIFKDAEVQTCITVIEKHNKTESFEYIEMLDRKNFDTYLRLNHEEVDPTRFLFIKNRAKRTIERIKQNTKRFTDYFKVVSSGAETGNAKLFKPKILSEVDNVFEVQSKLNNNSYFIEKDLTNTFIKSTTCKDDIMIYLTKNDGTDYTEEELKNYPYFMHYFNDHKEDFLKRYAINGNFGYTKNFIKEKEDHVYIVKSVLSPNDNKISIRKLEKDEEIWGGLYITVKDKLEKKFLKVVNSKDFLDYYKTIGIQCLNGSIVKLTSKMLSNFYFK
jgi:adenine-specific DNA-methyltransferase